MHSIHCIGKIMYNEKSNCCAVVSKTIKIIKKVCVIIIGKNEIYNTIRVKFSLLHKKIPALQWQ